MIFRLSLFHFTDSVQPGNKFAESPMTAGKNLAQRRRSFSVPQNCDDNTCVLAERLHSFMADASPTAGEALNTTHGMVNAAERRGYPEGASNEVDLSDVTSPPRSSDRSGCVYTFARLLFLVL